MTAHRKEVKSFYQTIALLDESDYLVILMQQDYDDALGELQIQLSKGLSLNELRSTYLSANTRSLATDREEIRSHMPHSYQRRHNVDQWLQKHSAGHAKSTRLLSSSLLNLVEKSMGGDNVVSQQCYHVGNYEIVVSFLVGGSLYNTQHQISIHVYLCELLIIQM